MIFHSDFRHAIVNTIVEFKRHSELVHTDTWQGLDVSTAPEMQTHELLHHSLACHMSGEDLAVYQNYIQPSSPWADDHFAERVSGKPMNPDPSEAWWPFATDNSVFKTDGKFSHTYSERYWPRFANRESILERPLPHRGIRFEYGDLEDVAWLLVRSPHTRQAYMPVWFPEDTGATHRGRVPCSLGYHFIMRADQLDVVYYIRSCDLLRHFRNDLYLTVRLHLWLLDRCRQQSDRWKQVKPGRFICHFTSLHCFRNDWRELFT